MYSVNRRVAETAANPQHGNDQGDARRHKDVSPELKEVMHLLKMMESGKDLK
jgi:hypothetical protein